MGNQSSTTSEPLQQQSQAQHPYQQQPYPQQPYPQQQNYYQNQNQFQVPPPITQQPTYQGASSPISQTVTIQSALNLHKKTLKVEVNPLNSKKYLTFRFDTNVECSITIYIMATEVIDSQTFYTKLCKQISAAYEICLQARHWIRISKRFIRDRFRQSF